MFEPSRYRKLGIAWLGLCLAVAVHITDEALTGFLSIYNPSVQALRERWGWFPMPTFGFREWLFGLMGGIILALLLTPLAFRGSRVIRPIAWVLSIIMILNAGGHMLATILGRTVESVRFPRPAPGFYSSPLLLIAAIYLIMQLRRTARISSNTIARSASG
jgi:hypothetical protein